MRKAPFLIAIVAICRLVPTWDLRSGARLLFMPGLVFPAAGCVVPVAAMASSRPGDRPCDRPPFLNPSRWIIYGSFALTTRRGRWSQEQYVVTK